MSHEVFKLEVLTTNGILKTYQKGKGGVEKIVDFSVEFSDSIQNLFSVYLENGTEIQVTNCSTIASSEKVSR